MSDSDESDSLPPPIEYCPHCSYPPEYCEYSKQYKKKCKPWLQEHHPELLPTTTEAAEAKTAPSDAPANAPTHGNNASESKTPAAKPATTNAPASSTTILIFKRSRNKRKHITAVQGLESADLELKPTAKKFSKAFACSASVVKTPVGKEVVIQGDVTFDLPEYLVDTLGVDKGAIFMVGKGNKRTRCFPK